MAQQAFPFPIPWLADPEDRRRNVKVKPRLSACRIHFRRRPQGEGGQQPDAVTGRGFVTGRRRIFISSLAPSEI